MTPCGTIANGATSKIYPAIRNRAEESAHENARSSNAAQSGETRCVLFEELRRLIEENTREELRSELIDIAEEIEQWQAEYDVETKQELEWTLAEDDYSSVELRERRDALQFWRENEQDRRLINHALELYSDIEAAREENI